MKATQMITQEQAETKKIMKNDMRLKDPSEFLSHLFSEFDFTHPDWHVWQFVELEQAEHPVLHL